MRTPVIMAAELFRHFETHGLEYTVVGDVSEFPERIRSDLDIVVEPAALKHIVWWLWEFFEERGARLTQILQHEQAAWHCAFAWENETGSLEFLHPDICGDYYRDGRLLLTAGELLSDRVRATRKGGEDLGFYVPKPATAFIYYLLKRVDKSDLASEQGAYLAEQWRKDPKGAEAQVRRFWRGADATRITEAAEGGDWQSLQPFLPGLRGALRSRIGWRPSWWLGEMNRIVRRLRSPTGVWVAFLGPDGSGKSTVIERVRKELAPTFRRTRTVHLRPSLGRPQSQMGPVTEPHADPPRSLFSSIAKLGYWLFDYTAGYLVQTRPALTRSTLVLYDRYYPDLLADPLRYRYGASLRLARKLLGLIPHPDLYVIMDVPSSEIHKRKKELPIEEVDRQREVYHDLMRDLPNAHLVNASVPPEEVGRRVATLVLDYMEGRVSRQFGQREEVRVEGR